jgi:hypothetical protein
MPEETAFLVRPSKLPWRHLSRRKANHSRSFTIFDAFPRYCLWGRGSKTLHAWFSPACTAKAKNIRLGRWQTQNAPSSMPMEERRTIRPHQTRIIRARSSFVRLSSSIGPRGFGFASRRQTRTCCTAKAKKNPSPHRPLERRCSQPWREFHAECVYLLRIYTLTFASARDIYNVNTMYAGL